jgi:hypothetical protein
MCLITLATVYRYSVVRGSIRDSREYTFLVETDDTSFIRMKSDLKHANFRRVRGEFVEEGVYRITVKCPPEKISAAWSIMNRVSAGRSER